MTNEYDAIIVGGGHNGLTCGAYLAKAGLKTLVLERRHIVGGAAVTEEFHPGFRASTFSYIMGHVHPKVIRELQLEQFGLTHLKMGEVLHPLDNDDSIVFSTDVSTTQTEIARFSKKDAEAYPKFIEDITQTISVLRRMLLETPVDPGDRSWSALKNVARMAWRYRGMGEEFYNITDAMTQSAYDFVSRWFECEEVKALFCYWAGIGNFRGPRAAGTAYSILFHLLGENGLGFAKGGMGSVSNAIAAAGRKYGMEILTDAAVERVVVKNGRATGVVTEDGREFNAKLVASNLAAPVSFGRLVPRSELPEDFMANIDRWRSRGEVYKINCAVDRLPQYRGFTPGQAGLEYPAYAHIGPTIEFMERAYDDAKHGWYSARPFVSPITPSAIDNTLAPEGKHVVTLSGGHAPYELKGASWDDERDRFVANVFSVMDEFSPGFSESLIDYKVFLPHDLEDVLGMPGGHELHGEVALDQLFFKRPAPHYADYRSPIRSLYQCGSSAHPGGSVSAVPGHNAAREILKDYSKLK
ncbi:MAG: NAD(P)/FAD-dependent oxidoreductase [Alphaproteobacteria bacterium]|nr:MAG: NAD(P)/FAD-dependent oxidoreductase [Alphaproteobacteria bacterium]